MYVQPKLTVWLLAPLVACNDDIEILGSSFQELAHMHDDERVSFADEQWSKNKPRGHNHRGLQKQERGFGDRCGNRNGCAAGNECTEVAYGNRCLPDNNCLEESFATVTFDEQAYKDLVFAAAGYSESEFLAALSNAKSGRDFLQTDEWEAITTAFRQNMAPLKALQERSSGCIDAANNETSGKQDGTVSYIGLHIEGGLLVDFTLNYLVASLGTDQKTMLRMCPGLELGAGAEVSFVFGFTNTDNTANMLCVGIWLDIDIIVLAAAGVAIGCGFNGVFFYEFTIGGGAGLGIGTSLCASFEQASTTDETNQTSWLALPTP
ncbi:expressed unknown protein [Seminavis robusta]|uniref:Uncharacterized protein n=1 Tax=Seminavis robusta TaxID=568900 RepID=A0A9N8EH99_9STRA|nr:expressed unknown protein [Seminavis robusta]|eukprot:Sro935_g222030.1 n/a (321) ;mRNA; r:34125-35576